MSGPALFGSALRFRLNGEAKVVALSFNCMLRISWVPASACLECTTGPNEVHTDGSAARWEARAACTRFELCDKLKA